MSEYDDSFRLAPFQEFYAEIIRLKHLVGAEVWVSPYAGGNSGAQPDGTGVELYYPAAGTDGDFNEIPEITTQIFTPKGHNSTTLVRVESGGNNSPASREIPELLQPSDAVRDRTAVWHSLVTLFQRQAITAWKNGGSYGAESYKESQYVMVALADEIFLHMEWEGRRAWDSHLLEAKIFRTHAAGQVFFENVKRLLREQNPTTRDLAKVYLMALSLGFKGKYYGANDRGKLADYRRELFTFIYGRSPDPDDKERYVFPEAYYHNVREERQRKLSDPRQWLIVLCLVIIVYVAATQAFWIEFTRELNTVNQRITRIIGELKAQP